MKKLFAGLSMVVALMSVNVSFAADPEGYQAVSKDDVGTYARAALLSMSANWLSINPNGKCDYDYAQRTLKSATGAMIRTDGGQPLLIFSYLRDETTMQRAILTTSADFKTVTALRVQRLELGEVNTGDLRSPVLVKDFVVAADVDCSK